MVGDSFGDLPDMKFWYWFWYCSSRYSELKKPLPSETDSE